jgi:hypothetical protein
MDILFLFFMAQLLAMYGVILMMDYGSRIDETHTIIPKTILRAFRRWQGSKKARLH